MAQRKETKTTIKVRDLKPKKDAKGGVASNVSTRRTSRATRGQQSPRKPQLIAKDKVNDKRAAPLVRSRSAALYL